jgi:hypothetical protein
MTLFFGKVFDIVSCFMPTELFLGGSGSGLSNEALNQSLGWMSTELLRLRECISGKWIAFLEAMR